MPRRRAVPFAVAATAVAISLPAAADARTYHGYVTGSGTITLENSAGNRVSRIPAGSHVFRIHDLTSSHNFVLRRRTNVLFATTVSGTGVRSWTRRIRAGRTYRYECTPHRTVMYGTFRGI